MVIPTMRDSVIPAARRRGDKVAQYAAALCILAAAVAGMTPAVGQQQSKVVHIGFLQADAPDELVDAFRDGLNGLGYVEGQNVVIETRFAYGHCDRLAKLADELVRMNVNVIVTSSTPGTLAAQRATSTIPIVTASVGEPSIRLSAGWILRFSEQMATHTSCMRRAAPKCGNPTPLNCAALEPLTTLIVHIACSRCTTE